MEIHIAYIIAALSTTSFVILWFWVTKKELRMKQSMLKSAESQFNSLYDRYKKTNDDKSAKCILERSLDIYYQSLELYNKAFHKPWFFIPGVIMGYRKARVCPAADDMAHPPPATSQQNTPPRNAYNAFPTKHIN